MNILVVNDDGYNAVGIKILAKAFKNYGNVYVVAPHIEKSGASSSITINGLVVHKHSDNLWSVEGTPSDCVKYGLFGLDLNIDLVVSGINNGFNIGIDTIYSGTIGAAMEALLNDRQAIAFSCEYEGFDNIESKLIDVIEHIFKYKLTSNEFILNVNFPNKLFTKVKGIKITNLGINKFTYKYIINDGKSHLRRTLVDNNFSEDTDLWACENGYTSITPLKLGNGDKMLVDKLQSKVII